MNTKQAPPLGEPLSVVTLGELRIGNPKKGEPPYLSAASGVVLQGRDLYAVGDDEVVIGHWELDRNQVLTALRTGESVDILEPGRARRIIPGVLPRDQKARVGEKPDFEALTCVSPKHFTEIKDKDTEVYDEYSELFPHGLLLMAGSGGVSWTTKQRRSIGVVRSLGRQGNVRGFATKVSFEGLHNYLATQVPSGKLNIEGITVYGDQLVLAQRGNSLDRNSKPAPNQLIYLSLAEVLRSLYTDYAVDELEVNKIIDYKLGYLPFMKNGKRYDIKLDFTDNDTVEDDPAGRLIFTAAAEGTDEQVEVKNEIAGSAIGVINTAGDITQMWPFADPTIKFEGINAWYTPATDTVDVLLVSDADDPTKPAKLMAARIPA